MQLITFRATHGTVFQYRADLTGELLIQVTGEQAASMEISTTGVIATVGVPVQDLMQFAAHAADAIPMDTDEYDTETGTLILEHVGACEECGKRLDRCPRFCELLRERAAGRKVRVQ